MEEVVVYVVMGLSVLVMIWIAPRLVPRTAAWLLALLAVGCAALAVGFFWVYRWAGYPVLAYLDGIVFGLGAVQAVLVLWLRRLTPGGERPIVEAGGESRVGK
jgi:hypothetical protein